MTNKDVIRREITSGTRRVLAKKDITIAGAANSFRKYDAGYSFQVVMESGGCFFVKDKEGNPILGLTLEHVELTAH